MINLIFTSFIVFIVIITIICFFSSIFVSALKNNNSDILLLPYKFGWAYYNVTPPWYSSMAQAEALPILIEAYNLTGSQNYLDTANGILNSFFLDVKDGGVTYKTNDSGWWYELAYKRCQTSQSFKWNDVDSFSTSWIL